MYNTNQTLMNSNKFTKLWLFLLTMPLIFVQACSEDEEPAADPVASFQYEIDADNYLMVSFTNFSSNATTYAWDFGDGTGTSTEANPSYTYAAAGDYTVKLTASNADGKSATFEDSFTITDPNAALKLLTGETSKTWRLYREGTAMSLGPDAENPAAWWAGLQNDGSRPCLYQQEFTFHLDGTYEFDDMGSFWAEYGVFNNVEGCDQNTGEACIDATAANMVNACGEDVSAWLSGTHSFSYDAATGELTLTGEGAWIGIPKLGTTGETRIPVSEVKTQISIEQFTGYDVMLVEFIYDGVYWPIRYASYSDESLEPALLTESAWVGEDLADVTPTEMFVTFASKDAADIAAIDTVASGAGIEFGVDDPADAAAAKVGKYTRTAGVQYQELKFTTSPDQKDINFSNFTTVSLDVFIPADVDFSGDLQKAISVGIAEESEINKNEWWTGHVQWDVAEADVAIGEWKTYTFTLATPDSGPGKDAWVAAMPTNFDLLFISIGGGGHEVGADFYIRNFEFK